MSIQGVLNNTPPPPSRVGALLEQIMCNINGALLSLLGAFAVVSVEVLMDRC